MDVGESPFSRTPTSRLFPLSTAVRQISMSVQALATVEALAAVVQNDARIRRSYPQG